MLLITGYDVNRRAKVINRWMQLERGEAVPLAAKAAVICRTSGGLYIYTGSIHVKNVIPPGEIDGQILAWPVLPPTD